MTLECLIIGTPGDGGESAMSLVTSVKAGSHPTARARSCYGADRRKVKKYREGIVCVRRRFVFCGYKRPATTGAAPKAPFESEQGRGDHVKRVFDAMKGHSERARTGGGWARYAV